MFLDMTLTVKNTATLSIIAAETTIKKCGVTSTLNL